MSNGNDIHAYPRKTAARPARPTTTMEPAVVAAPPVNLVGVADATVVEFLDDTGVPDGAPDGVIDGLAGLVGMTVAVEVAGLVGMTVAVEVAGQALTVTVTTDGVVGLTEDADRVVGLTEDAGGTT